MFHAPPVTEGALQPSSARAVADRFTSLDRVFVKQERKWLEVLLSAELKNAYEVFDGAGGRAFSIREIGVGTKELLSRMILGPTRPFEMSITDLASGAELLRLKRKFRFIFHHLDIYAGDGTHLASVDREWSWVRKIYNVTDPSGAPKARIVGPFFKPWTFELVDPNGTPLGAIKKKWSGLGREMFSDADNFSVELDGVADPTLKAILVAAVVLIDVVHFERTKR